MKIIKKLFISFLSVSMALGTLCITSHQVKAEDEAGQPDLYYVALGDSITAGYSLPDAGENVVSAYTNYKSDSSSCYPNIVANYFKEYSGYEGNLYDMYSNLGSCGMKMADFIEALKDPDYYLPTIAAQFGVDSDLLKYYKLYREEIAKADVLTLYCGNNDIATDFETKFGQDALGDDYITLNYNGVTVYDNVANPVMTMIWQLTIDYTMGANEEEANQAMMKRMSYYLTQNSISKIDLEGTLSAMEYTSTEGLTDSMIALTKQAEALYPELIDAIYAINPDVELMLVGFYSPYGNSMEADGVDYKVNGLVQTLLSDLLSLLTGSGNIDEIIGAISGDEDISESTLVEDNFDNIEMSYPALYLVAGIPLQNAVESFNSWLKDYADSINVSYIDIYNIPNDTDVDPHPTAEGHAYIAQQIIDAYQEDLNVSVTGTGSAVVSGPSSVYYKQQADFTIQLTNDSELIKVLVNGKEVAVKNNSFTLYPKEDCEIEVVTAKYGRCNISVEGSGNATVSGPERYEVNADNVYTITPDEKCHVDYVTANGGKIKVENNQFTVNSSALTMNIVVHMVSEKQVTIQYYGQGNVTIDGPDTVDYNTQATYIINADEDTNVTAIYVNGSLIHVTDNQFTITVKGKVNIEVESEKKFPFTDVPENKWYYDCVYEVYQLGLMTGKTTTTFDPSGNLTRGQLVTILYRVEGSPEVEYSDVFTDVAEGKYYSNAVIWAQSEGIVQGYQDNTFKPSQNITRQELAIMLRNYAKHCGADISYDEAILEGYPDQANVSSWARVSLSWAVNHQLISGSNGYLLPRDTATRGQAAKMILATYHLIHG